MEFDYAAIALRVLHISAALTAAGGAIFARFALLPGLQSISEEPRATLHEAVRRRWSKCLGIAILVLIVSGMINLLLHAKEMPVLYHMLAGIKIMLAMVVFFIASLLAGRSTMAARARQNAAKLLSINLLLIFAIVCIGATLRGIPKKGTPAESAKSSSAADK